MNILFLSLSFSTANHRSFYEDLLMEFQNHGHHVYVVCAKEKRAIENPGINKREDGLTILRVPTGNITGSVPLLKKGIATLMIDYQFLKAINRHIKEVEFDLVLYPTPPITLVNTITIIKKRTKAKTYVLLKDIFPQNAVDLGMMKKHGIKGLIYKYFRRKEQRLYHVSDFIGCMSPANVEYVLKHNPELSEKIVEVCPNCLKVPSVMPNFDRDNKEWRSRYGIPKSSIVFLYGGNLGKPQGIDFLIKCLYEVRNNERAFFLIIGDGSEYKKIKSFIDQEKPKNVKLLHYLPKEEYQSISNLCDVGMIFLDHRFTIPNFPSRILNYLASGNPVLTVTDPNTDIGLIARQNGFGFDCESNNVNEFVKAVDEIITADRVAMGKSGWEYLNNNWAPENGYKIIMNHFNA